MLETKADPDATLTILLVEDSAGDARYIEEMLRDDEELSERTIDAVRDSPTGEAPAHSTTALVHETRLSDGLDRLAEERVDVVLLDLNLPDSTGLATVDAVREHSDSLPVVVLTGISNREVGTEALRRGAEEYLVKDEINPALLVRSVHHAVERKARERERRRQRTRLETLNYLSDLVQETSRLAIESSTREEIERVVCDSLAASEHYQFAWVGTVHREEGTVTVRTAAGDGEPLHGDAVDDESQIGPVHEAVRAGETRVVRDLSEQSGDGFWREHPREHGVRSWAVIPLVHQDAVYGVLTVHSGRPDAFGDDEREVVGRLGKLLGHAINAVERKQALMSEDVVELRFRIENVFDSLGVQSTGGGTVTFDRAVQLSDDVFLEYGTVTAEAEETLEALVDRLPHFESMKFLGDGGEERRFELRLTEPPVVSAVASRGGRVDSATISEGTYSMVVHVPPDVDVARVVDTVQTAYPEADVVAKRDTTRSEPLAERLQSAFVEDLTDRQRRTLEAAFLSGFFEWPRDATGEEVAESMGITAATFHQHLRVAQRKLLEGLVETDRTVD